MASTWPRCWPPSGRELWAEVLLLFTEEPLFEPLYGPDAVRGIRVTRIRP